MGIRQTISLLLFGLVVVAWGTVAAQPAETSIGTADAETHVVLTRLTDQLLAGELTLPRRPLDESMDLARTRADLMSQLMRSQPQLAHEAAVPASLRARLRPKLADSIEEIWYGFATFSVLADFPGHSTLLELPDGRSFDAHVSGARKQLQTKIDLPVAAVIIGGEASVSPAAALRLDDREMSALIASGVLKEVRSGRDLGTGAALSSDSVAAVVGDRVVRFEKVAALRAFEAQLMQEEARLGPHVRTEALLESLENQPDSSGIDFPLDESPWTETPKSVLIVIADFADLQDDGISQSDLQTRLNGNMSDAVRDFSHGATWLAGDVSPKVVLQNVASYTTLGQIRTDAFAALADLNTGLDPADYDLLGVVFPRIGFTWAGIASLGGTSFSINGAYADDVYVHEIGHNYGLEHASLWRTTDGSVLGPLDTSDYVAYEYGNRLDVMGWGNTPEGHFTVHGKQRMDWLESQIAEVSSGNSTQRIHASDHRTSDEQPVLAVRAPKCSDGHYWVEVRSRLSEGFGFEYEGSTLSRGVLISWQRPQDAYKTYLLNFGPGNALEPALEMGRTWSDPAGCVHLTPIARGGSGVDAWADVQVNFDVSANMPPTAVLRSPPYIHTRVHTRLEVEATDPDGDDFAYFWQVGDEPSENSPMVERYWEASYFGQVQVTVSDMKGGVATPTPTLFVVEPLAFPWTNQDVWSDAHVWEQVHTDGNRLVVVGGSSWVARSDNGVNWTLGSTPGEFVHFAEVNKLGNRWVGQGLRWDWNLNHFKEAFFYSNDGLVWTAAYELAHQLDDVRDMACNGSSCVAVGPLGVLVRSTDGVNWTRTTFPGGHSLYNIVWTGAEYRATGYLEQVGPVQSVAFTSPDGISWSSPVSLSCLHFPLYYTGGAFYGRCGDRLERSLDGVNFVTVQRNFLLEGIEAGNGVFIATGWDSFQGWSRLISADGSSWHRLFAGGDREPGVVLHSNRFIVTGGRMIDRSPEILLDSDRDGIPDTMEQALGLDPNDRRDAWLDLDGDGLENQHERYYGTNIGLPDTDGDGLGDGQEISVHQTSPTMRDTDLDGYSDGAEIAAGSDPLDRDSCPGDECYEPESSFLLKILPILRQQQ